MTVQTPPEPGRYPSAPAWARPPDPVPAPAAPPVDPTGHQHGQLLVRFPGEVRAAGRPEAPSWRPVVCWTFFLSVLGIISALRRSGQAHRYGRERSPYWIAYGLTVLGGAAVWAALTFAVAVPAYHAYREDRITTVLQDTLAADSRITAAVGRFTSVTCLTESDRDAEGLRTYLCTFDLATGKSTGMYVVADTRGNWQEKE
ncbi:hypothetical protein [Actinoplanes flavus]|uniref:DUF4333 domain-containing protein n=1 Tax=Actinoplanes flavus TaxID=2820290 RepID=A0ABS3UHW6_9ACTN|nr:hypothetical protein [Actinoplanes flavus]MBO3738368.1 hypothetical protein [Actinoplanes flavus]